MALDKKISELSPIAKNDDMKFPVSYNNNNYSVSGSEISRKTIQSLTTSRVISSSLIEINASSRQVIATLPPLSSWIGKSIFIKNKAIGFGLVQRSGSDVIGESLKTSIPLYWEGDYLELFAGSTRWEIKSGRSKIGGKRNTSDWTNTDLASIIEVDIDGGSSPSLGFELGEIVTESTSNYEARIYDITDNGDGTGTLWLYDCDGNLTDGRTLTGDYSGVTATVNEGSGTTKDLATYFRHNYDENISDCNIKREIFVSTDGTENNMITGFKSYNQDSGGSHFNLTLKQVSSNIVRQKTGAGGLSYIDNSGVGQAINTNDWYQKGFVILSYGG